MKIILFFFLLFSLKSKLSIAAIAASIKLVPPPAFIFSNFFSSFFSISPLFNNPKIFSVLWLKVISDNLSFFSSKVDTNLIKASLAKSNLDLVSCSSVQYIEPDTSKAIDKSIGSLFPIPSYLDFNNKPRKTSFLNENGLREIPWDISKFWTKFFSGDWTLK